MMSLPAGVQIFLCTQLVEGRNGIDGLSAMVEAVFQQDSMSGHLFVFLASRAASRSSFAIQSVFAMCRSARIDQQPFARDVVENRIDRAEVLAKLALPIRKDVRVHARVFLQPPANSRVEDLVLCAIRHNDE